MSKNALIKGILLLSILTIGFLAQHFGWIDFQPWHEWLRESGDRWWTPVVLVLIMILLYGFALPGSLAMLSSGVIYRPLTATFLSLTGGVLGALAAFFLSRFLTGQWTGSIVRSPLFATIRKHTGFVPFCLMRMFPGFPHSIINYGAGILDKNLLSFLLSTAVGFTVKGFVYTSAAYNATHFEEAREQSVLMAIWPLAAIMLLTLFGYVLKNRFSNGRTNQSGGNNDDVHRKDD